MKINSDLRILITGGTGSFGKNFLKYTLNKYPDIKRLVVFSRDELKQWELQEKFSPNKYPGLRYFLGDIRDQERLRRALEDIDIVVHAAALKQVPAAEYNPIEFVKTNILGTENLINACLDTKVKKVIAISTDKASCPVNLYGASKLCSEKLFIAANNIKGKRDLNFSVVRYGNVMGSRGSVIPYFLKSAKNGVLPITDPDMTRFNILIKDSVKMVYWAIANTFGGEILVPKLPAYKIKDLANAIGPNCKINTIGIRAGEKIHEEMISQTDSYNTYEIGNYFLIVPSTWDQSKVEQLYKQKLKRMKQGNSYNSGESTNLLTIDELRKLIIENLDSDFTPV